MKLKIILIFILFILATFVFSFRNLNNDIFNENNLFEYLNFSKKLKRFFFKL